MNALFIESVVVVVVVVVDVVDSVY